MGRSDMIANSSTYNPESNQMNTLIIKCIMDHE
jgi:hypothetical protein